VPRGGGGSGAHDHVAQEAGCGQCPHPTGSWPCPDVGAVVAPRSEVSVSANLDDPSAPVIRLAGELDVDSVGATKAGIDPYLVGSPVRITFDLEKLTFMDSSGIALLVQLSTDVGKVSVSNVTPIVHRVLEATGLLEHFGLAP
jgi:anti-sigma B factor antagonist